MVEFMTLIAWACVIGIPALILGFGAMINQSKPALILAWCNYMVLLGYFMAKGHIEDIFIILTTIIMALVTYIAYKSVLVSE